MRSVRTSLKDPFTSAEDLLTQLGDITPISTTLTTLIFGADE